MGVIWQNRAACAGDSNPEWIGDTMTIDTATTCWVCPVRLECLTEALPRDIRWDGGIWGGSTPRQRGDIRTGKASVADVWLDLELLVKGMHGGRHDDMVDPGGLLAR